VRSIHISALQLDTAKLAGTLSLKRKGGSVNGKLASSSGETYEVLEEDAAYAKQLYTLVPNSDNKLKVQPVNQLLTLVECKNSDAAENA